ncbi:serine hydrolase domain-containing protein [Phytomonospora endophytica]|uniref:CubicO group peptidase (Beta-lactamase class C family) n=1 Tax=Phytomonospora endophytica TaxID=714109 RepID=A0A841FF06_9ACTN|nr:serine hydrolase domain-containing protein [Phytomonospora endophytica]MBB6034424.1 CubicO group peptidase (beta-lactamase class C family) [Phytomonospora endophytica]GIG66818.1 hypothetical protein Pen01_31130 [Phytomonospora endophytica]
MTDALTSLVDEKLTAVPGAAVAVRQGPEPRYRSCHGFADLEWGRPVTPTTVFRLASLSKPFTALTVRLLAAAGVIDLDAPIARHLPDLPHGDRVTPRHLLTHTSGIPNFVTRPGFRGGITRRDHTDDEVIALFAGLPLDFEPGTRYGYSNSGYRLLDVIASRAAGAPFAELAAEHVFAPAGMTATRVLCDEAIVPERARGYQRDGEGFVNAPYVSMTIPGGAGGMGSTLDDLLAFDTAVRDGVFDLPGLYDPVRLDCGRTEGYGHGWYRSVYRGRDVAFHAGGIEGFSAIYVQVPAEDLSVVLLTNLGGFRCGLVARAAIDVVLDLAEPVRPTIHVAPATLCSLAGAYVHQAGELTVEADGDTLLVTHAGEPRRMRPVAARTFADLDDPDVTLDFHDGGAAALCLPLSWVTGHRES